MILLAFDVSSAVGIDNVWSKWYPEVSHHLPSVPIILVATKIDLRADPSCKCSSYREGKQMALKIGAASYLESSALKNKGVVEIFQHALKIGQGSVVLSEDSHLVVAPFCDVISVLIGINDEYKELRNRNNE